MSIIWSQGPPTEHRSETALSPNERGKVPAVERRAADAGATRARSGILSARSCSGRDLSQYSGRFPGCSLSRRHIKSTVRVLQAIDKHLAETTLQAAGKNRLQRARDRLHGRFDEAKRIGQPLRTEISYLEASGLAGNGRVRS